MIENFVTFYCNYVATEKTMLRHSLAATGAARRKNMCRDKEFYVATGLGLRERYVL